MLITWSRKFELGIPKQDEQHKQLVDILNKFHQLRETNKACKVGRRDTFETLNRLVKYTNFHFDAEEKLMEQTSYPGYEDHRALHGSLIEQIFDLNQRLSEGGQDSSNLLSNFLREWLLNHILVEDLKIAEHLYLHGIPDDWS